MPYLYIFYAASYVIWAALCIEAYFHAWYMRIG